MIGFEDKFRFSPRGRPENSMMLLFIVFISVVGVSAYPRVTYAENGAGAPNAITSSAVQMGVLTCASKVQEVTSFLGATDGTIAEISRPKDPPDQNSFAISMTVPAGGKVALAVAEFYPSANGCTSTYTVTARIDSSCEQYIASSKEKWPLGTDLSDDIKVVLMQNLMRMYFIEDEGACTIVKTETLN